MKHFKIKKLVIILIVLMLISIVFVMNLNKSKVKNNTLIKETNNKSFAYFVQEDNDYKEYKSGTIPTGYKINYTMTKCYDYDNKEVTANLTISMNKNKLSVLSNKTVYCTVYLDKQKGTGTKLDPYQIEYIEDLVELSNEVNGGTDYSGMYFALTKNLDFNTNESYRSYNSRAYGDINNNGKIEEIKTELTTDDGFIPIGLEEHKFMGNFDGKENTLSNLHINSTRRRNGLFSEIQDSTISNLAVTGSVIQKDTSGCINGGLVAITRGISKIENCHSKVNVTSNVSTDSVGGIVGDNEGTLEIIKSHNEGSINGSNNAGGLVGLNASSLIIENSYNSGLITNDKGAHAGGLLGRDNAATNNTKINKSYNIGNVTGRLYVGGLIGVIYGVLKISNSYNCSKINYIDSAVRVHAGGLIGSIATGVVEINTSYNSGNVTGFLAGGLAGSNYAKTIIDGCYNLGNIDSYEITISSYQEDYIGGLFGINASTEGLYILNSYNQGNVTAISNSSNVYGFSGGIIGVQSGVNFKSYIINSYNSGAINTTNRGPSGGVARIINRAASTNGKFLINNFYNIGSITGLAPYGIGYITNDGNSDFASLTNVYYDNSVTGTYPANLANGMTTANMKNISFVNTLNTNKNNINLSSIDSNLAGYTLRSWILGQDGYPILGREVKDLSGKNNNAESFGVLHSYEGVTTGYNQNGIAKKGIVDLGLSNHDFGNSLSLVARVKFSNLSGYQEFFNSYGAAGEGFVLSDGGLSFSIYSITLPGYKNMPPTYEIEPNLWYTLVGTYDGSNLKLYINGQEKTDVRTAVTGNVKPSPVPIYLGANPPINDIKNVGICYSTFSDVLIFDRALTADEISKDYKDIPNPQNKDELLLWYQF